jgi:hypothetical protein
MNTMASQRDPNVSIGCACYTITHDKKGWGELWGDVEGHYYPMVIQRGTVVSSQIEQVAMRTALSGEWEKGHRALQDGRFIQQKQATSGSSENDEVQLYAVEVGVTDDPDDTI